ncbi:hypothetical protein B9479_005592 [Cryptococcus floricola]|uniref:Zn(2)-C6 fungal-type domain-containing protein n=1 Tax=Cryptococcus floricola TaxID=2591691 RepID=A0A5D3ASS4_9TREE|nr:hypothetical protein B9479_005592 [Cryptococcus floricola]
MSPSAPTPATPSSYSLSAYGNYPSTSASASAPTPSGSHSGSTSTPDDGRVGHGQGDGQDDTEPGRKRRKVTRSRLGCFTCRKRRKLCDMGKPVCQACTRLKMECVYPPDGGARPPEELRRKSDPANPTKAKGHTPYSQSANVYHPHLSPKQLYDPGRHVSESMARSTPASNTMDDFVTIFGEIGDTRGGMTMGGPTGGIGYSGQMLPPPDPGLADWFGGGSSLDEATLQLWAADCLAVPTTQTFNAFESLNSLLQPTPPSHDPQDPTATSSKTPAEGAETSSGAALHSRPGSRRPSPSRSSDRDTPTTTSQTALLIYFHESLARLVSCTGDTAPSAFEAFTKLANMTAGVGPASQGLHLSILAWAARHMVNRGLVKYEAVSEKFSGQATSLVDRRMAELFDSKGVEISGSVEEEDRDREYMTLLAAAVMLMQFKICRGDVWAFNTVVKHLTRLVPYVFRTEVDIAPDSMYLQFFENVLYHDVLSSFILNQDPMVPEALIKHYHPSSLETLHTLTGASLPLFSTMHRIASLVRQRRAKRGKRAWWSDEELMDVVTPARELERVLEDEKKRLDALVLAKPHVKPHRYLHEAFRTACLLQLHYHVLNEAPASLPIRLLVRQSLSLLEAMADQNLPGLCSAHWVIFTTALCCVPGGQEAGVMDDRERVDRIYDDILQDFGFLNVERSRKIVHEVWSRNVGGAAHFDWLDLLEEYDWEIFVV